MKLIESLVKLIAVLLLSTICGCKASPLVEVKPDIRNVLISAHRGGPTLEFPENALETLQNSVKLVKGVMLEIDVLPTSDDILVLMHDDTLGRTTTLNGSVKKHTLEDLKKGFLRNRNNEPSRMKVATLTEVFDWIKNKDAYLSLDLKDKTTFYPIIEMIRSYGLKDKVEIITYSIESAELIHKYDSEVYISVFIASDSGLDRVLKSTLNHSKVAAFTGGSIKDKSFYHGLKQQGFTVTLGTMGTLDSQAMKEGFDLFNNWSELGIDRFATDYYLNSYKALKGNMKN